MLAKGEIDLFGDVTYTPERAEMVSFSTYPQGKGTYWLYAGKGRNDLTTGDIENLNGCKIGVTEGSYQEGLLEKWLQDNQIQAETVLCTGYDDMMEKLDAGELDVIAAPDLSTKYNYQAIISIGFNEYYFAVSKARPDILKEFLAEQKDFAMTDSVLETTPVIVYQGKDYQTGLKKIAATYESIFTPGVLDLLLRFRLKLHLNHKWRLLSPQIASRDCIFFWQKIMN